jgi:hypothetical protein
MVDEGHRCRPADRCASNEVSVVRCDCHLATHPSLRLRDGQRLLVGVGPTEMSRDTEALTHRIPFVAPPKLLDEPNSDPGNRKSDTNGDE